MRLVGCGKAVRVGPTTLSARHLMKRGGGPGGQSWGLGAVAGSGQAGRGAVVQARWPGQAQRRPPAGSGAHAQVGPSAQPGGTGGGEYCSPGARRARERKGRSALTLRWRHAHARALIRARSRRIVGCARGRRRAAEGGGGHSDRLPARPDGQTRTDTGATRAGRPAPCRITLNLCKTCPDAVHGPDGGFGRRYPPTAPVWTVALPIRASIERIARPWPRLQSVQSAAARLGRNRGLARNQRDGGGGRGAHRAAERAGLRRRGWAAARRR